MSRNEVSSLKTGWVEKRTEIFHVQSRRGQELFNEAPFSNKTTDINGIF